MSSFTNRKKILALVLILLIPFAAMGVSRSNLFDPKENVTTSSQSGNSATSIGSNPSDSKVSGSKSSSGNSSESTNSGTSTTNEVNSADSKKSNSSTSKVIKTGKYGYKGYKDSTDTTIEPILKGWDETGQIVGEGFTLPDVASASNILKTFQKDFPECKTIINPIADSPVALSGTVGSDTLSGCSQGDPTKSGFNIYFISEKQTVISNSGKDSVNLYTNFKSPFSSKLEQNYFTPSSRALVISTGGDLAFDANEVSWGILYDLGFTPPKR